MIRNLFGAALAFATLAASSTAAGMEAARAESAAKAWEKLANQYASTAEKAAKTAAEIRKAGEAAGKSEVEIQRLINNAMPKGNGKDPLADWIKEAEKADKARMDMLRERESFEEFLGKVLFDDAERQRKAIEAETDANRQRADAWRDLLDPTRKYAQQLEEINRLMKVGPTAGGLSQQEGDLARFLVGNELDGLFAGTDKKIDKTKDAARELGLTFQSAFEDAIIGGKSLQEVLSALGRDIMRIFIRKAVTEPLANALVGSLNLGSLFGGGKAVGGPVSAGTTYLVGERGPELLHMGSQSGRITPNGAFGGGLTINSTINAAPGINAAQFEAMLDQRDARLMANIGQGLRRGRFDWAMA